MKKRETCGDAVLAVMEFGSVSHLVDSWIYLVVTRVLSLAPTRVRVREQINAWWKLVVGPIPTGGSTEQSSRLHISC